MAKKKSSSNARNPKENPEDLSPDSKLDNLKTLNQLLVKETMEKRSEIDQLKAQIEKGAEKERSLEDAEIRVGDLERENAEIRQELGQAVFERDEMERMGKKKEEAFDSLKELMEEAERERDEMRDEIEANVAKIGVLEDGVFRALKDKQKLEMEIRALKHEFGLLKREEEGLRFKVIELEKGNGEGQEEIGKLRASIGLLEREKEEKVRAFESKIGYLEDEGRRLLETRQKLEGEIRDLKEGFGLLKREEEGLRSKVTELEKGNGESQDEISRLRATVSVLEKEKEVKEREFESKIRDLELSFDATNEKAQEEIASLTAIISGLENNNKVKEWEFESKIRELSLSLDERNGEAQEEIGRLRASIIAMEKEVEEREKEAGSKIRELALNCEEMSEKLRQISSEKDEVEKARTQQEVKITELKKKEDGLKLKVVEFEEKNGEAQEEIRRLRQSIVVLENEKLETGELVKLKLDESSKKMREVLNEKDEIEKVRAEQEVEILELKKEAEKLQLSVQQLEDMCRDYVEKNAQLLDERDSVKREFAVLEKELMVKDKEFDVKVGELAIKLDKMSTMMKEISMEKEDMQIEKTKVDLEVLDLKKEVARLSSIASELEERCNDYDHMNTQLQYEIDTLKLQVDDLKMGKDECFKELVQLNSSLDTHVSEKEAAKRNIESLEKSLLAAKEESDLTLKKFSDRALTLLKRTAEAMNGSDNDHENGIIDDDDIIRPFVEELESVKGAFKSKVSKIEEMNREIKALQKNVTDAKNKKLGLFMWLCPAATTALAAISFAYAARAR